MYTRSALSFTNQEIPAEKPDGENAAAADGDMRNSTFEQTARQSMQERGEDSGYQY